MLIKYSLAILEGVENMSVKKVDNIHNNHGYWYIRYKDPVSKQWKSVSTKLKSTKNNYKPAIEYRDKLFREIEKVHEVEFRTGDIQFAFEHFKELNSNKSQSTKNTYKLFFQYFTQKFALNMQCSSIGKKEAEAFLLWINSLKHLQQNSKFCIQKNFLKLLSFLFEYDYIPTAFIVNKNVRIRPQIKEPIIFTNEDRKKVLDGLSEKGKSTNFKTMIYMLMYTGLRPSDIINLTVEQTDLSKMEFRFYSSKTNNWFVRPIHEKLKDILTFRIEEVGNGKLFDYSDIKNMGRAVRRYLSDINLSKKGYTIRTFRKDFISRSQEKGISISATAQLVGHSNIKTTMTYYTKLSANHLKEEIAKLD